MHRVDTPRGTRDHSAPSTIEAVRVYTVRTWGSIEVDCIVPDECPIAVLDLPPTAAPVEARRGTRKISGGGGP
ncbi:MAG: hypothetical protein QMC96_12160 [Methanomicrobiales archaeon]|nr:hypothetical protein [Methanomicrobiales archaeon]